MELIKIYNEIIYYYLWCSYWGFVSIGSLLQDDKKKDQFSYLTYI